MCISIGGILLLLARRINVAVTNIFLNDSVKWKVNKEIIFTVFQHHAGQTCVEVLGSSVGSAEMKSSY